MTTKIHSSHPLVANGDQPAANDADFSSSACENSIFLPLTRRDIFERPPVQWSIKGLLPATGLAVLYGPSAVGKSFLTLDLACALARGHSWFGLKASQSPVLYASLEGQAGLRQRILAWEAEHACQLPGNLGFLEQPLDLRNLEHVRQLIAAWRTFTQKLQLTTRRSVLIFDTLARCMPGADENNSAEMGLVLNACQLLIAELEALVILVHHTGKDTERGPRGHSSLIPAADASLLVTAKGNERCWTAQKVKDGADGIAGKFFLKVHQVGIDDDGDRVTSCAVVAAAATTETQQAEKLTTYETYLLEALRDVVGNDKTSAPVHVPANAVRDRFKAHCGLTGSGERTAWGRAIKSAQDRGWISVTRQTITVSDSVLRVIAARRP